MRPLANPKGHPKYPFNSPGSPSSIPSSQASVTLARNRPSRLPPRRWLIISTTCASRKKCPSRIRAAWFPGALKRTKSSLLISPRRLYIAANSRLPTNPSKTSRRSASLTSSSLGALLGCWSGCSRDRKPET
ncbi:hypothetical protein COL26b_000867 [Colletotrichum chrysophilum]|uniref:uncharacterized protein n=1 Tax=Colletotrichum chrysophilum TaxID=1836956 RepID=UPI002301B6FC|nr:uncharacterized protein COL26b_000867 [Colletotrichum chrysophilum]KAJ0381026.1 hypothetical protein COL26b_000867 [Colletotrichum chrysophilum]